MRPYRGIIILAAICVALAAAYFALASNKDASETGFLYQLGEDEAITNISLENGYGRFEFSRAGSRWTVSQEGNYRASEEKMRLMLASLEAFPVERGLDKALPEYGLENPAHVRITTSQGKEYGFDIGAVSVSQSGVYIRDHSDGRIYIASTAAVSQLDGSIAAYRDKEVFTIDKQDIRRIAYYREGQLVVDVVCNGPRDWAMTWPIEAPARHIELNELAAAMRKWKIAGFPEGKARAEMGLDAMAERLEVTDGNGNTQRLEIGAVEGAKTYVRTDEGDNIALLYTVDLDLDILHPETLLFVTPLLTTTEEVRSISIQTPERTLIIEVENGRYTCEGRELSEEQFVSVLVKYMLVQAAGYDESDGALSNLPPAATLQTDFADGGGVTLTLYERDGDTYWMEYGEGRMYYAKRAALEQLLYRLESILK